MRDAQALPNPWSPAETHHHSNRPRNLHRWENMGPVHMLPSCIQEKMQMWGSLAGTPSNFFGDHDWAPLTTSFASRFVQAQISVVSTLQLAASQVFT